MGQISVKSCKKKVLILVGEFRNLKNLGVFLGVFLKFLNSKQGEF